VTCVSQAKSDQEQTPMKTQPPGRPSPVRDKILALLKSGPRSVIDLAKATDASDALVSYHLKTLEQRRLVGRSDPKDRRSKWQLSGRGMTSVAATTANPAPAQRARGRKCAQPPVDGLAAALQRLRPLDRAPISDLDTKVQVLDRLGRVVDPTIAAVLTAISKDLRAAA
jgi:DNA-binding transcriptional ArsR family regulator